MFGEPTENPASPKLSWPIKLLAAIGVFGALALVALVAFIFYMMSSSYGPNFRAEIKTDQAGNVFAIGQISRILGTNLLAVDIRVTEASDGSMSKYGSSKFGYSNGDVRNVILLDRNTGNSRRLLPDNRRIVDDLSFHPAQSTLRAAPSGQSTPDLILTRNDSDETTSDRVPAAYYLLTIRTSDDAMKDVVIGTLATGQQGVVMSGIQGIEQHWMLSASQMGLIVRDRQQLFFRVIDIPTLKVVKSVKIDIG